MKNTENLNSGISRIIKKENSKVIYSMHYMKTDRISAIESKYTRSMCSKGCKYWNGDTCEFDRLPSKCAKKGMKNRKGEM